MKKQITYLLTILISMTIISCNGNKKKEKTLFDEVMTIHDEVMPKMEKLYAQEKASKEKIKTLEAENSPSNPEKVQQLKATYEELKHANDAMMQWMRAFKTEYPNMTHKEIMTYLEEEKINIEIVKTKMNEAEHNADRILKN